MAFRVFGAKHPPLMSSTPFPSLPKETPCPLGSNSPFLLPGPGSSGLLSIPVDLPALDTLHSILAHATSCLTYRT